MTETCASAGHKTIDSGELRRALGRFATGVTVVTTRGADGRLEGLTANSFSSVSLDPPLILWCLSNAARSLDPFVRAEWFAVNVLASHQHHLSRRLASAGTAKYEGVAYREGLGGAPVLADSLACLECSVYGQMPAGDHTIFLGRVERLSERDGEPLLFSAGRYCVAAAFESGGGAVLGAG